MDASAGGRIRDSGDSPASEVERAALDRFISAWHAGDVPSLVCLLARDAPLIVPPAPTACRGRTAIGSFFSTVPAGGDLKAIRLVGARADGQPAVAAHLRDAVIAHGCGIMVLTVHDERIGEITGFADPARFPLFELDPQIDC